MSRYLGILLNLERNIARILNSYAIAMR